MKITFSDIVSSLALFTSIIALGWNIIRDILIDRTSIEVSISFGEVGNIKGGNTTLFAEAGSLKPAHKFDNLGMLVKTINTGRRDVVISNIGGELKNGEHFSMVVLGLPKLLKPYEEFSKIAEIKSDFMELVKNDEIKKLWAIDTKNKKWLISKTGFERFKETAHYINSGKNL